MKCMDCLPLLEEFFDGETDEKTGERMRAHLASCADCAEAFDALRAEQEMFLRYDRGLEVTPALWQGVRARIAGEMPEPRPQTFLSKLRERLAAAVAVFSLRPTLAMSLASLLVVGIAAGLLWQAIPKRSVSTSETAAVIPPAPTVAPSLIPPTPVEMSSPVAATTPGNGMVNQAGVANAPGATNNKRMRGVTIPSAQHVEGGVVELDVHAVKDDLNFVVDRSAPDDMAEAVALLDADDEAVARHVERAQVLLRSFKNARPTEGLGDIAYERELSRKLLDENISLQLEADAEGNKKAKQVLSSLEPYLLDISNLRERPSRGEVRSIRERMEKQEIIAALHVYDD